MSVQNRLLKYTANGAVAWGALYYLSNGSANVRIFDTLVPMPLFAFGVGAASSMAADFVTSVVLPYLPQDQRMMSLESTAVNLASGAGAALALAYVANKDLLSTPGTMQIAAMGAAAEIGGQWVYQQLAKFLGIENKDLLV
jgi:hypothetical protein